MTDREKKIQEAMDKAQSSWDEKYSQSAWNSEVPRGAKIPKYRRIGKGFASKALKNLN